MKYLSFVVPSYNAENYLNKCVDSLLIGGEDVEIIIVNDGSKDNTLAIANDYLVKYPSIVKVVDKENGGHGSGVNAGVKNATGLYFKCVDADDWVDKDAYLKLLETIKKHYHNSESPDMYFVNYVFERLDLGESYVEKTNKMPKERIITWKDVKKLGLGEFFMMHQMIVRLDVIKQSNVLLPEHTFYVDNVFAFVPLKYVKTIYYLDVDFYRYYVGRPNQSVTIKNMSKNYLQQIRVLREMVLAYSLKELKALDKHHYRYMIHDLIVKSYLTLFYVMLENNKEKDKKYKEFWQEFKLKNKKLYYKLRYRTYFAFQGLLIKPLRKAATLYGYERIRRKTRWT